MNVVRCDYDGCENTRPADDVTPHGWLHVEASEDWTLSAQGYDFCTMVCLAAWSGWRAAQKTKGVGR